MAESLYKDTIKEYPEVSQDYLTFLENTANLTDLHYYNSLSIQQQEEIKYLTKCTNYTQQSYSPKYIHADIAQLYILKNNRNIIADPIILFDFYFNIKNKNTTFELFALKFISETLLNNFNEKELFVYQTSKYWCPIHTIINKLAAINSVHSRKLVDLFFKKFKERASDKPKIAVCFYGILRGHFMQTLEKSIKCLTQNMEADCFLFAWDVYQKWPGITNMHWAKRLVGDDIAVPISIDTYEKFEKNLPNVFNKLKKDIKLPLHETKINKSYFKRILLEPELQKDMFSKIYYGIYKSFNLLEEYEKQNGIRYDFVFIIRSDSEIIDAKHDEVLQQLNTFKLNQISEGIGDGSCYGRRDTVKIYASLYQHLDLLKSPLFNNRSNHDLIPKWLYHNEIYTMPYKIVYSIKKTDAIKTLSCPNIDNELKKDLKENKVDSEEIRIFFKNFLEYFKGNLEKSYFFDKIKRFWNTIW